MLFKCTNNTGGSIAQRASPRHAPGLSSSPHAPLTAANRSLTAASAVGPAAEPRARSGAAGRVLKASRRLGCNRRGAPRRPGERGGVILE